MPIMTPRPVAWVPHCVILGFDIFIMGGIMWLYLPQGLFMICAPDTDVTTNTQRLFIRSGSQKKIIKKNK